MIFLPLTNRKPYPFFGFEMMREGMNELERTKTRNNHTFSFFFYLNLLIVTKIRGENGQKFPNTISGVEVFGNKRPI